MVAKFSEDVILPEKSWKIHSILIQRVTLSRMFALFLFHTQLLSWPAPTGFQLCPGGKKKSF